MHGPKDSHRNRPKERFYRRLLGLYPQEFRADYGAEMTLLFEDRAQVEPWPRLMWDVVKDAARTAPKEHFAMLYQDLKYSLRQLAKSPGFTTVAILSLALGIGANSAIFTLADGMLLRPLPVRAPNGLLFVQGWRAGNDYPEGISYPNYVDLRDHASSFAGLAASVDDMTFAVATSPQDQPQIRLGGYASVNLFRVAGVPIVMGRDFSPEDEARQDAVAILTYDGWKRLYDGDPNVVGRRMRVNGVEFTVIGVTAEPFTGLTNYLHPSFYIPCTASSTLGWSMAHDRGNRVLAVRGRLKPGVTMARAQAELTALAKRLEEAYPDSNRGHTAQVRTEFRHRIDRDRGDAYVAAMLMATVMLVLLIACANVANLLLARGRARAREIAVRLALGANQARLFRQFITESLLLALGGGALGILLAVAAARLYSRIPTASDVPIVLDFAVDTRVLLYTFFAAVASAVVFGVVPAYRSLRMAVAGTLKAGEVEVTGRRVRWFGRHALVAAQLAVSCVLLVAAAMNIAGIRGSLLKDPGFRCDHVLMMSFDPNLIRRTPDESLHFYQSLLDQVRALPGVRAAGLGMTIPTDNERGGGDNVMPEGYQLPKDRPSVEVYSTIISDGYLDALGIPVLQGRGFQHGDTGDAPRVAIVNQVFAEKYWPKENPIGKRFWKEGEQSKPYQVIGVARNSKYMWISEPPTPVVYFAWAQQGERQLRLLVHTEQDPALLAGPIRTLVKTLDAQVPVYNVRTMADYHAKRTVWVVMFLVRLVTGLGLLGLTLALVGLYGVMAYSISRRTREIGIRMALGASNGTVLGMVLRQGGRIALIGMAIGMALAVAASKLMQAALVGLAVAEPLVFVLVPALLIAVALGACYFPARRAAMVEPTRALRYE